MGRRMVKRRAEDPRLMRLTKIALALPGATRQIYRSHAQFLVRKKTFAYFLDNHHGDGIVAVCVKTRLGENSDLARERPSEFYLPAYIGPRGWSAFGSTVRPGRISAPSWNGSAGCVR